MSATKAAAILNLLAAFCALVAAFFWFKSSSVKVRYDETNEDAAVIIDGNTDFIQTVVIQSQWSKRAAIAATFAALFQAAALLIQNIAA